MCENIKGSGKLPQLRIKTNTTAFTGAKCHLAETSFSFQQPSCLSVCVQGGIEQTAKLHWLHGESERGVEDVMTA